MQDFKYYYYYFHEIRLFDALHSFHRLFLLLSLSVSLLPYINRLNSNELYVWMFLLSIFHASGHKITANNKNKNQTHHILNRSVYKWYTSNYNIQMNNTILRTIICIKVVQIDIGRHCLNLCIWNWIKWNII